MNRLTDISGIQEAIRQENLDGWLFCNFSHRDKLTDRILRIDPNAVSTRSWYYFVPASGEPVRLVHGMERSVLDPLPGTTRTYTARAELEQLLESFSGKNLAILSDKILTVLSTTSAGHHVTAESAGINLHSAAPLVQRLSAFKTVEDYESHQRAGAILFDAVTRAWKLISQKILSGTFPTEGEIRDFLFSCITGAGMITNDAPIVAAGENTATPHYQIPEGAGGMPILPETLVQFDLWGKFPDGMYADISWVGYTGRVCPDEYAERFRHICTARDLVVPAIDAALSEHRAISGAEIDALVREHLCSRIDDPAWIRHRTGHAIDRECHGSGVNLDSVEFPDSRPVIEGSCFSIEPGIYCDRYGMRTEINAYVKNGKPEVSTLPVQMNILLLQD